jgi:hypothetical protein
LIGLRRTRVVINMRVSASKQRFFVKKRAKNFIRLATSGGRSGQSLQPPKALRAVTKSLARSAVMKFFCFFLFTKRRPYFLLTSQYRGSRPAASAFAS